jgi:pimeloyl-ACP methyl ester carboxylesterase
VIHRALALGLGFGLAAAAGCALVRAERRRESVLESAGALAGTISVASSGGAPLVVVLGASRAGEVEVVDHFVRGEPGRWIFRARPGSYWLGAYRDVDRDQRYDPAEPGIVLDASFALGAGDRIDGITLRLEPDARPAEGAPLDLGGVLARAPDEQLLATLGQVAARGVVADWSEPRFGEEAGSRGYWDIEDFIMDDGPGIYFMEPYDPSKVPVLFVHGAEGYGRQFETLARSLDAQRFQPWLYIYPSGIELARAADLLVRLVTGLAAEHGIDEIVLVAHSMGGLVARSFLFRYRLANGADVTPIFVTLSTPWGGVPSAALGAERSPIVVPSWRDVAPDSPFLRELFYTGGSMRRPLPPDVSHHLLFSFQRDRKLPGVSGDTVVSLESSLRTEAQEDAVTVRGFDATHTGILDAPATSKYLDDLLDVVAR